ncbi:hypothetical protein E4T49_08158 [Aureobasidium sp. EXF-10728]|nr:hypothetical protein E4T49_08158 [Aureobasidium sp. EXF-10728]
MGGEEHPANPRAAVPIVFSGIFGLGNIFVFSGVFTFLVECVRGLSNGVCGYGADRGVATMLHLTALVQETWNRAGIPMGG